VNKLVTIIRHEYLKRVRSLGFIFTTVLGPLLLAAAFIIPVLIAFIQPSPPRIAVLDQSNQLYETLQSAVAEHRSWPAGGLNVSTPVIRPGVSPQSADLAMFKLERAELPALSFEESKRELVRRVRTNQIEGFLIIPADVLQTGKVEYFGRNSGDPISDEQFDNYVRRAIIEQRLARAGVERSRFQELTSGIVTNRVQLTDAGEAKTTGAAFFEIMGVGLLLFITLISYGGMMLTAVSEEKESRLAEILFSSVRSFTLLLGKLIGVSLVAFTQYAIWLTAFALLAAYGADSISAQGSTIELLALPFSFYVYLVAFFFIGYYIFATIYAVLGAMMTNHDDSSSLGLLATAPLLIAFSMSMPVMRSPNSWVAIVGSFVPFMSPILMPIRIAAQTPPFWQILLSLFIGIVTILLLLRLAAKAYHTAMLMYGKKISLFEIIRWVKQT
jgi:ABC-2 type transport system permease protein